GEHWDEGAGLLRRLTVQLVPTGAQRINGVKAGDLDLGQITSVDVPEALRLIQNEGLEGRDVVLSSSVQALLLRAARPALASRELRQAVNLAIDKEAIGEGLYGGTCNPTHQYFPEGHWAHSERADEIGAFDPDRARQLVEASGVADPGFDLVYYAIYEQPVQV